MEQTRIGMYKLFGIFLVGSTVLFFASNSVGSLSVEQAVQKRIETFKTSGVNTKKLSKLIRSGDIGASLDLVNFHVKWSEEMLHLFPTGSEASTANGSDASSDIWRDKKGFEKRVKEYNLRSIDLREAIKSKNIALINETYESLVVSCKRCHRQFRN